MKKRKIEYEVGKEVTIFDKKHQKFLTIVPLSITETHMEIYFVPYAFKIEIVPIDIFDDEEMFDIYYL